MTRTVKTVITYTLTATDVEQAIRYWAVSNMATCGDGSRVPPVVGPRATVRLLPDGAAEITEAE